MVSEVFPLTEVSAKDIHRQEDSVDTVKEAPVDSVSLVSQATANLRTEVSVNPDWLATDNRASEDTVDFLKLNPN